MKSIESIESYGFDLVQRVELLQTYPVRGHAALEGCLSS